MSDGAISMRVGDSTYLRELEERYGDLHFEALWYQCFLIDTTYGYKSDHGGEHLGWALFVVAG